MTLTNRLLRHRRHRPFKTHALLALALVVLVGVGCRSQNSNDSPTGGTTAAFAQTATGIAPGIASASGSAIWADLQPALGSGAAAARPSAAGPRPGLNRPGCALPRAL